MPINFDKAVNERSTMGVEITLRDENDALIPQGNIVSMTWSLTDNSGNPINARTDVAIVTPDSTVVVTLQGADLQIVDERNDYELRHFEAVATVNTGLGTNLPIIEAGIFRVINLKRQAT